MATAPYGVRLLVGAAVTAIEETRKLPQTILMYPMTMVSTVAQMVMKVQQDVADLVIKGDEALDSIFPPRHEQPEWATFDEDLSAGEDKGPAERRTEGRFALYSVAEGADASASKDSVTTSTGKASTGKTKSDKAKSDETTSDKATAPAIAGELEYESLTLAQLRTRLTSLSVAELEALLAYEEASKSRAPFQTLLANRITRATGK